LIIRATAGFAFIKARIASDRGEDTQTAGAGNEDVVRLASNAVAVGIGGASGGLAVRNKRARSANIIIEVLISTARRSRLNTIQFAVENISAIASQALAVIRSRSTSSSDAVTVFGIGVWARLADTIVVLVFGFLAANGNAKTASRRAQFIILSAGYARGSGSRSANVVKTRITQYRTSLADLISSSSTFGN
jgi:hypothetical protein